MFLIRSRPHPHLAKQPCSVQTRGLCKYNRPAEHEVTASEVTANDKPREVLVTPGTSITICVDTEAHPKQKEIFPERSQPGRGTPAEEETKAAGAGAGARATVGNADLQLYMPAETASSPLLHKTHPHEKKIRYPQLLYAPRCLVPTSIVEEECRQISSL